MNDAAKALFLLRQNWWAIAVRGLIGILMGIIAFLLPLPSMVALVWLFGAYAFLDGLFNLVTVWRRGQIRPWWAMVLKGVVGIGAGFVSFIWPAITALALVYLIATWAIATGCEANSSGPFSSRICSLCYENDWDPAMLHSARSRGLPSGLGGGGGASDNQGGLHSSRGLRSTETA